MNYSSILFSPTFTTRKIAQIIAQEIFEDGKTYDLTLPSERYADHFIDDETVLIIGAPVYSGRLPEIFVHALDQLEIDGMSAIAFVTYGNRAYEDALLELKDLLEARECTVIAAAAFVAEHSCVPAVATGRPDQEDLAKIKEFAKQALERVDRTDDFEVRGNRPYRERKSSAPLGASTHDHCSQCRLCAEGCPVGAIQLNDCRIVDETLCIRCFRCVRTCPVNAKYFDERFDPLVQRLTQMCAQIREEPEWFL